MLNRPFVALRIVLGFAVALLAGIGQAAADAPVRMPIGWFQFCTTNPAECANDAAAPVVAMDSSTRRSLADAINRTVNANVRPITDAAHFGSRAPGGEWWTYPDDGAGDCEDYALMKRKLLIEAGFAAADLLLTVVRTRQGEVHTVLSVRLGAETVILDNLSGKLLAFAATGHTLLARQSAVNANVWVGPAAVTVAAVSRSR